MDSFQKSPLATALPISQIWPPDSDQKGSASPLPELFRYRSPPSR
uniref:Uncharacterized protein n=1 Tax=Rhizophora mucronata TaxID=61149 RepID=A0A2P2QBU1_RHIMU